MSKDKDTEQATDAAEQKSGRFRSWFKPKMSWAEAQEQANEDLADAERLDRRGLLLGRLLVALVFCCIPFAVPGGLGGVDLIAAAVIALIGFWAVWRSIWLARAVIHYWHPSFLPGFVAVLFAFAGAAAFAVAGAVAGAGAVAAAVAGAFAAAVAGTFLSVLAGAGAFAGAVTVASAVAVAFVFAVAGTGAGTVTFFSFAGAVAAGTTLERAFRSQIRAERNDARVSSPFPPPSAEPDGARASLRAQCTTLMNGSGQPLTLGLAGRRGLGKTNLLRLLLKNYAAGGEEQQAAAAVRERKDLKDSALVAQHRVRTVGLFVRAPTDFGEMSFLTALLEQLAQTINRRLSDVLPDVRPYEVERELEEKRRRLRSVHWLYAALAALIIAAVG